MNPKKCERRKKAIPIRFTKINVNNNRSQESHNVTYFKEIKRLKSLQNADAYLEPKEHL